MIWAPSSASPGSTPSRAARLRRSRGSSVRQRSHPSPRRSPLLGDLQAASGASAEADRQFETVRFVKRLGEVQSTVFDRPLIRFELDHGGASEAVLAEARASLAARPDASGHDAVGVGPVPARPFRGGSGRDRGCISRPVMPMRGLPSMPAPSPWRVATPRPGERRWSAHSRSGRPSTRSSERRHSGCSDRRPRAFPPARPRGSDPRDLDQGRDRAVRLTPVPWGAKMPSTWMHICSVQTCTGSQ